METNNQHTELKRVLSEGIEQPSMSFKSRLMTEIRAIKTVQAFNGKTFLLVSAVFVIGLVTLIYLNSSPNTRTHQGYDTFLDGWRTISLSPVIGYCLVICCGLFLLQLRLVLTARNKSH